MVWVNKQENRANEIKVGLNKRVQAQSGRYWQEKKKGLATPNKKRYIFQMELLFGIVFTVGVLFFIMNRGEKFAVKNRDQAEPRDNGELFGIALIVVFVLVAIFATQQ